ncbi:MAG: acyl-CoA dehydrogenase family protein [Ilumatobacteraceae bacterium]
MDFSFSSDQNELRTLVRQILLDNCTPEHLKQVGRTDSGTDLALWKTLADAGAVGIGLPESAGGGGLGITESSIVLEEIGRAAAPVPALAVIALAGPALAAKPELLKGVADGDVIVTAAIHEPVGDVFAPTTVVVDGRLSGTKVCVPHGLLAARFVVTAADGLYVVEADDPGVTVSRQDTTTGVPDAMVEFDGAKASCLGGPDAVVALIDRGIAGSCVMLSGACDAALRLTAEYTKNRRQFDKQIASFQAVSQRAGDSYIDTEAVRLTAWQAIWRLDTGHPAAEALMTAKFWAAEGGWRVMHAAHHLHGGMGVDRDYPLHRFFLMHKQLELQLGSAQPSLLRLGRMMVGS